MKKSLPYTRFNFLLLNASPVCGDGFCPTNGVELRGTVKDQTELFCPLHGCMEDQRQKKTPKAMSADVPLRISTGVYT